MLSFDENGWLFPDPLKNITHDIDSAEIDDLLKLAKEEDYWSAGIRETVKKRLEKDKDDVRLDWIVEDLMIKNTGGTVISMPFGKDIITFNSNRHFFRGENQQYLKSVPSLRRRQIGGAAKNNVKEAIDALKDEANKGIKSIKGGRPNTNGELDVTVNTAGNGIAMTFGNSNTPVTIAPYMTDAEVNEIKALF